jgi:hypothetical protein
MAVFSLARRSVGKLWRKVRTEGALGAVHDLALKAVNRVIGLNIMRCMVLEGPPASPPPVKDERLRYGFLTPEQVLAFAQDPANEMSPEFARAALAEGDECYGILDGEVLAASCWYVRRPYGWFTRKPSGVKDDLVLRFPQRYVYVNKGFTREEYRGRRLHAIGRALAYEEYRARGFSGFLSIVMSNNFASLRSNARMGNRGFGTIVLVRAFGRAIAFTSRGCATYGFSLERRRRPRLVAAAGV